MSDGERVIVLSHISSPCKLRSFHFSTSFVEKSILENKHSVSSLRVQVNLDFVHVFLPLSLSHSFFFLFSERFNRFHMSHMFHPL